jgi:hypothetical protein
MRRLRPAPTLVFLLALCALAACEPRAPQDEASARRQLKEKGTLEVLKQAERAEFAPAPDGHLTRAQVEMYLAVRRRERVIRAAAVANLRETGEEAREAKDGAGRAAVLGALQAVGDVGDVATAALRAAQELGFNSKEYKWVAKQVEEARITGATQGLQQKVAASRAKILELLEERAKQADDPKKRRALEGDIAQLRLRTEPLAREPSEAARFNAALLAEYADELAAVRREEVAFYADRLGVTRRSAPDKDGGELGKQ